MQVRATLSSDFIHAGDFSYKCKVKMISISAIYMLFSNTNSTSGGADGTTARFSVTTNASTGIVKVNAGGVVLTGTAVTVGVVQEIEVRRVGNTVSLIQDGVTTATVTSTTTWGAGYLGIGGNSATVHFNGYVDKFVVTKG